MNKNSNKQNNFKVGHDIKDISEGVEYEFILKDRNVLDEKDDLEELENVLMKEENSRNRAKEKKNKDSGLAFNENHKRALLSQYDEKKDNSFLLQREDLGLNEENVEDTKIEEQEISEEQKLELNKIKEKFKQMREKNTTGVMTVSLNKFIYNFNQERKRIPIVSQPNSFELKQDKVFTNDYMTQEEFKSKDFKKLKSIPLKKRIQSIEPADKEDLLLSSQINDRINNSSQYKVNTRSQVYDEYDELNLYLEKQRNLINRDKKSQPLPQVKIIGESKLALDNQSQDKTENQLEENTTEFISDTTQFLQKVATKKEIDENYNLITSYTPVSLKDLKGGHQSVVNIPLPNERLKYGVSSILRNNFAPEEETKFLNKKRKPPASISQEEDNSHDTPVTNADEKNEEINESSQQPLEEMEEPLVGKGIATALQVLKNRGLIGRKELWGRFKDKAYTTNEAFLDKKQQEQNAKDRLKSTERFKKEFDHEVNIEYRDNRGRLLTPKEMYRYQSYIFHGKGPGRKKTERKLLREQLEERMKNQDPSLNTKSFLYLKNMQKKTNTPYLVLQGRNPSLP